MKEVILTKKAKASNGKNPPENFSKLTAYAYQASKLAKNKKVQKVSLLQLSRTERFIRFYLTVVS